MRALVYHGPGHKAWDDIFGDAASNGALKVVRTREEDED
jgi:hypothetical protein